jgi:hypothetical protein
MGIWTVFAFSHLLDPVPKSTIGFVTADIILYTEADNKKR